MAIRRYRYAMHHQWVTEFGIGSLYPIFCQEVTPGDSWSGHSSGIVRLAPMVRPAMATLTMHVHYFFVPHRIVWDEFEDMVTGQTTPAWPTLAMNPADWSNWALLFRFFGLGTPGALTHNVNALPFRAYNKIWNEFFRDQEMQAAVTESTNTLVQRVNYPTSDYYAGIRDEIQQGTEETVNTAGATLGVTEIRDAFHRQKFKERRSQFGERYHDYLAAMGLSVPDSRLDRPEHVARSKTTMGLSEVLNTSNTDTGDLAGHGIAGIRTKFRKKMFVEHGTLIGVAFVRPRNQIQDRIDPHWLISDKDDLFQQEFARDTQVVVDNREVRSENASGNYAYQRRDQWLRTARDTIAGGMLHSSNYEWHGARNFNAALPAQNAFTYSDTLSTLFQDQTATAPFCWCLFDHHIGKRSMVPSQRSLA